MISRARLEDLLSLAIVVVIVVVLVIAILGGLKSAFSADLPNRKLTPGAVDAKLTQKLLCSKGFHTGTVRNVPDSEKRQVLARYHYTSCQVGKGPRPECGKQLEFDHLISLEIGGSDDVKNIWPQPYVGRWNAHVKDALEDHLHSIVCKGKITLRQAQREIATNWIAAYRRRIGK